MSASVYHCSDQRTASRLLTHAVKARVLTVPLSAHADARNRDRTATSEIKRAIADCAVH